MSSAWPHIPPFPPSILRQIENYRRLNGRRVTLEDDEDRGLAKAEEIIRRIRHREIYRFINEIKIPPEIGTSQIDRIIRVRDWSD
jgi:hypothetical protein